MKETVASVFDDLEIGIMLHDPETGAIRGVNDRLEELYGYSEAELRELSVADYSATDEEYTQAVAEARIQAAAAGEPQALEWVIERPDGERVPVRVRLARTEVDGEAYVIAEIRDISDRKQQAANLEAERGFIEQSLEALDDAFYLLDPDGRLRRWNATFAERTGYSAAELDGMSAVEFVPEGDHDAISESITEVLTTGSSVVEAELLATDGGSTVHEFTGSRLTDSDGTARGIIGIGRDISARKKRLDHVAKQEQAFRNLHETTSTADPFEEKMVELLEFGREYMGVEQGFFTRIDGDTQRIAVGVGQNEQLQTGASAPFSDSYCRHTVKPDTDSPLTVTDAAADGWADDPGFKRFGLGCYVGSEVTVDDETVGTICFADRDPADREFTETQETFVELLTGWAGYELERADRERKYRRLTERISDSYYAVDTDFTVTYWNDTIADRLAVPREEVVGETLWEYFPEITDTIVEDRLREAMATGEPTTCEYYYEPADYWTVLQIYPDDDGLAVISKDITDRKEYERQLERSNERLQEFAYILSHDLQEPLRMVSSYIDLIETELADDLDAETQEYMEFAVDGAERMRGMIDGLLQYSRVESEGEAFSSTDTAAVLDGVLADLTLKAEAANAEIDVGSLPTVHADADQLGQLFQNLIKTRSNTARTASQSRSTPRRHLPAIGFPSATTGRASPRPNRTISSGSSIRAATATAQASDWPSVSAL
ncbi:MAG: PAS sensor histidine kinase [Halonotius sp. J07HN4]|nr:MAG: PAS sensor histidine kinase [Halonotius sp. J07HN4]